MLPLPSSWRSAVLVAPLALASGCGESNPQPATPGGTSATSEPANDLATAGTASEPSTPAAESPRRKPFEIYSNCGDVVQIAFGPDPKAASAGRRTIAPSSAIDGPRDAEGNQTVWLLDPNGDPLIKVQVTRGMKRVEVGKSCRTLDAR